MRTGRWRAAAEPRHRRQRGRTGPDGDGHPPLPRPRPGRAAHRRAGRDPGPGRGRGDRRRAWRRSSARRPRWWWSTTGRRTGRASWRRPPAPGSSASTTTCRRAGWASPGRAWPAPPAPTTEWLAFVDADVVLQPSALATMAAATRATSTSIVGGLDCRTFWERLLLPELGLALAQAGFPDDFASGQCLLVRRDAYEAVGGHGHPDVRGSVVDDRDLARALGGHDARLAPKLMRARMYRDLAGDPGRPGEEPVRPPPPGPPPPGPAAGTGGHPPPVGGGGRQRRRPGGGRPEPALRRCCHPSPGSSWPPSTWRAGGGPAPAGPSRGRAARWGRSVTSRWASGSRHLAGARCPPPGGHPGPGGVRRRRPGASGSTRCAPAATGGPS